MRRVTLAFVLVCLAACARSPTGRRQLILLPEDQMNALGERAFQEVRREYAPSRDPELRAYVACVTRSVLKPLHDDRQWEVAVFESPEVNAFALPGGKIGVFTGLLDVAETPDQLAAVIGHEVAHVLARHGAERVSQGLVLQGGLAAVDAAMADKSSRDFVLGALGLGATLGLVLPHSRTQENEADEIGVRLMAAGGFDPTEAVELWRNMARRRGGRQPPEFLSTHPSHETRIERLAQQAKAALPLYRQAVAVGRAAACEGPAVSRRSEGSH